MKFNFKRQGIKERKKRREGKKKNYFWEVCIPPPHTASDVMDFICSVAQEMGSRYVNCCFFQ